jgi:hypothetical protein
MNILEMNQQDIENEIKKMKKKIKINYFDYTLIPDRLMENMKEYAKGNQILGGFLDAVFCNDLSRAVACADDTNSPLIPVYVKFIHHELPFGCHGSREIVEAWLKRKRE